MSTQIQLKEELVELDKKYFIHPTSSLQEQQENGPTLILKEAKGVYVTDIDDKTYLEGMSCLWNVNIGFGRKEMGEVAKREMEKYGFLSTIAGFSHEPVIRMAAKIAELTPGDLNGVFFTSGGSEANDTAYKLVRHYWKVKGQPSKTKIISCKRGYHGLAYGSTSATGIEPYHEMITSLAPGFLHIDFNSPEALRKIIAEEGSENIAAFITEPIQGAGGANFPSEDYLQEIRKICDENNILFIVDEVICGFGRTGKMFACEHYGVVPDVMLLAKGLTSGYAQLGAVVVRKPIHQDLIRYSEGIMMHGFTYSGHPIACSVGLKNIEIIENERLVQNSQEMGEVLGKKLQALKDEINIIGEVRYLGLLGAIEFVKDKETMELFPEMISKQIVLEARKRGLILRNINWDRDTIAYCPPLCINEEEVNEFVKILKESILKVRKTLP